MDTRDSTLSNISEQKTSVALLMHQFTKERRLAVKSPHDSYVAVLAAMLHLSEQDGVNFNDALGKARVKALTEKRNIA